MRVNKCGLIFVGVVGFLILFYAYGGGGGLGSGDSALSSALASSPSVLSSDKVSLRELLSAAIDVAKRGGVEVVDVRKSSANLEETVKGKLKKNLELKFWDYCNWENNCVILFPTR